MPIAEAVRTGQLLFLAPTGPLSTQRPTGGVTAGMGGR